MNKLKTKYNKVPVKALNMGLSPYGLCLYVLCLSVPEEFDPSIGYVCDKLKISRNSAIKAFKELVGAGMLKKIETGNHKKVSKYEFTNPALWITKKGKEEW